MFALLSTLALARAPDPARSERFVAEVVDTVADGRMSPDWLRHTFDPAQLNVEHPGAARAYYRTLLARLAPGQPLREAFDARPEVIGSVKGPEYVRVVLAGEPTLTVLVRRSGTTLVVDRIEESACRLCEEPERFVRDLLRDAARGDARTRLLAGVDLKVDAAAIWPEDPAAWLYALHTRNVDAGYVRWVLRGADVVSAVGNDITVSLRDRTETWTVAWADRWQLLYDRLAEDSPLRLDPADLEAWRDEDHVADAVIRWWVPAMLDYAGGTLLAEDVLAMAPRPYQGDILIYRQDRGRGWAMLAVLDPETGEVLGRIPLPTLPRDKAIEPRLWRAYFRSALSQDGRRFAVGAVERVWVIDVEAGKLESETRVEGVRALAWTSAGLAVADAQGIRLGEARSPIVAQRMVVRHEELWVVDRNGALHALAIPSLAPTRELGEMMVCCGDIRALRTDPETGALVAACAGECDPAWSWTWDPAGGPASTLADEAWYSPDGGTIAVDPSGRWMVGPAAPGGGRAALWDRRSREVVATFSGAPLRDATWVDGWLYGLDNEGRLARWTVEGLLR